ncbi:MAG: hypothetical protein ACR65T_17720 [Methylocystis sp.]|uniref:hypothetical protein n=1 Tax=Methylocystis sp. TaxID=1911079 RepID=UPI003DA4F3B9
MSIGDALFTATLSTVLSIGSAWLTARLALRRFVREKAWERKTGVYAQIFEALHDMRNWYDAHLDAEFRHAELDPAQQEELTEAYRKAKASLSRKLSSETWLLPHSCLERISQLERALSQRHDTFFEEIDNGSYEIGKAIDLPPKFHPAAS